MLVGRKEETKLLEEAYLSEESKFIAVYGRRRVGKTYLIREFFNNQFFFFSCWISKRQYEKTNSIILSFLEGKGCLYK